MMIAYMVIKENVQILTRMAVPVTNEIQFFCILTSICNFTKFDSFMLSSFSFRVLCFAFKSMIHFELIFVWGVSLSLGLFFRLWLSRYSSTTVEHYAVSTELLLQLVKDWLVVLEWHYLSLFCCIDLCVFIPLPILILLL